MMRDVRSRKIDCIIVKDLSRFGRNHIETGNYIEKIFPFMGVRFIAVTDNFDSMNISGQNETLGVNLKNLVNEMYAKDIAVKVKSSRQENGNREAIPEEFLLTDTGQNGLEIGSVCLSKEQLRTL